MILLGCGVRAGNQPGAAGWSKPAKLAGVRSLAAVSCPTTSFCMAVGGGQAIAYVAGNRTGPESIDSQTSSDNGLVTVSCVSPAFCVAGNGRGDAFIYGGTSWSSPTLVAKAGLVQISCDATRFCGAIDALGDALFLNRSGWSRPRPIPGAAQPRAIACASGSSCMAVDGDGTDTYQLVAGRWVSAGMLAVSTPAGGSEPNVLSAVGCSDATFCAALDGFGEAFTWARGEWSTAVHFDKQLLNGSDAVSCPSPRDCVAVDNQGMTTAWNGIAWSVARRIDAIDAGLADVSCATSRFCVAVDYRGRAVVYR